MNGKGKFCLGAIVSSLAQGSCGFLKTSKILSQQIIMATLFLLVAIFQLLILRKALIVEGKYLGTCI